MIDIVESGMLKRLSQGPLWDRGVTDDQRATLTRLAAKKLVERFNVQPHGFKRGGLLWRITDEGQAAI